MAIKPDHKYHGVVAPGSEIIESQSGSLGFQVMLKCEDGETSYTIWLTAKNRERAEKTFTEALGVDVEELLNATYIENQLPIDITGREVTFVTEEEEYKGKRRVKVAWLFKRSASSGGSPAKAAASFFSRQKAASPAAQRDEITDDDIPF
jgi:hypothetical protein